MCSIELSFVDLDTQVIISLGGADLTIAENNITFTTERLIVSRYYNVSILARNIAGVAKSTKVLSKLLIANIIMEKCNVYKFPRYT